MVDQQALLREAMGRLDLTRNAFAERIGVTRRALDTWLLPSGSREHRAMPAVVARMIATLPGAAPEAMAGAAASGLRARLIRPRPRHRCHRIRIPRRTLAAD